MKLHKNTCCPKCGGKLDIDLGTMGSYFDPPEPPSICCEECEWSPDLADIDWEDFDKPTLTAKQEARISRMRNRADRYRSILYKPENRTLDTVENIFSGTPEEDFDCDGEPEDVGNAWCGDESWSQSIQVISMGRKDGKTWCIVLEDSCAGCGDYQPVAGWDEREGDIVNDSILADLWFHHEGRSIDHFHGWTLYCLDVAITGGDPLENWMDSRRATPEAAIKAAMNNLKYLHGMVRRANVKKGY